MSTLPPVVLLTRDHAGPVMSYVCRRLLAEELIRAVVFVKHDKIRWKLRQAWRIGRRHGIRGIRQRLQATRLGEQLLGPYRQASLAERLSPMGDFSEREIPAGVEIVRAGTLRSGRTLAAVRRLQPLVAVQGGAGWVRSPLLQVPPQGFLGLHHGMLPAIRGMDSICWAYVEDRPEWIGITVQLLTDALDGGAILAQQQVTPEPREDPFGVMARATIIGTDLLIQAIRDRLAGRPAPPQPAGPKGAYRSALTIEAVHRLRRMIEAGEVPQGGRAQQQVAAGPAKDPTR
jgi:hypothetical protein